jgi:murein DD-endopeptidase MepM/ murein hydrolase activator NlpD
MAVGDGTVTKAGWGMGAGNVVRIRHNGTYETAYKHLNGFAKGIRNGAKVQQGQVIGFVGTTGLSTGPHLHFEFYQGGRYVDPLGKKFPSADPVPQQYLSAFQDQAKVQLSQLPEWAQWAVAPAEANTVNPSL